MLSLRYLRDIVLRSLAIVTIVVAVGCVLLPELDTFSWEKSYSKGHLHGSTIITAFFDSSSEDTDGDGSIRIWHTAIPSLNNSLQSLEEFSQENIALYFRDNGSNKKFFLLHRKLLL